MYSNGTAAQSQQLRHGTVGSYIGCYFFPLRKSACYSRRCHVMNIQCASVSRHDSTAMAQKNRRHSSVAVAFSPSVTWSTQRHASYNLISIHCAEFVTFY